MHNVQQVLQQKYKSIYSVAQIWITYLIINEDTNIENL